MDQQIEGFATAAGSAELSVSNPVVEQQIQGLVTVVGSAELSVSRLYDRLLDGARQMAALEGLEGAQYAAAVIMAGTACEVAAQRAVAAFLESRFPEALVAHLKGMHRDYDFAGNPRLQELWAVLSGEDVNKTAWWQRYTEHRKRRNGAVHTGMHRDAPLALDGAMKSIAVAEELISYFRAVLTAKGLADHT